MFSFLVGKYLLVELLGHFGSECFIVKVKVAQLCLTLCDPMDYMVLGTLQGRILEWVAFPFSRGSSQPGIKSRSPVWQVDSLPAEPQGKPECFIRTKNSLAFQWLRLHIFSAEGTGSIPVQGTKIPQAVRCCQKKKKSQSIKKFNRHCTKEGIQMANKYLKNCSTSTVIKLKP